MTRSLAAIALAALFALGGCDDGGNAGSNGKSRSIRASSPYVDQLKGLSELNRGLALRRAIIDTGQACKKVDSSAYQEDYKNLSVWTARCSDGKDWMLFIAPSGDVQVRSCTDAAALGLPRCRFDGAAPATGS